MHAVLAAKLAGVVQVNPIWWLPGVPVTLVGASATGGPVTVIGADAALGALAPTEFSATTRNVYVPGAKRTTADVAAAPGCGSASKTAGRSLPIRPPPSPRFVVSPNPSCP